MRSTFLVISACLVALVAATCDVGTYQCSAGALGCQTDHCLCLTGWRSTFPVSQVCEPICGDNMIVGNEECDGGIGCCGCKCDNGFVPTSPRSKNCMPVQVPVTVPVATPVAAPVKAPVAAPVHVPVAVPVATPVAAPVKAPVAPPTPCYKNTRTIADFKGLPILSDLFNSCFDLGLQVGVGGCNSFLNLTTSLSLTNLLGGIDLSLDLSLGNLLSLPFNLIKSLLSGQLVAAQLNLGLDRCGNTANCGTPLTNMCFKNNQCSGFSVDAVVQAGNYLFGGCASRCRNSGLPSALCNLSLAQISACLGDFNSAYQGGSILPLNGKLDVCANVNL